jgi:hypothetical protein
MRNDGKANISPNQIHAMSYNHTHLMLQIGIDVVSIRLAKTVVGLENAVASVPLATDPADAVHQAKCR